MGEDVVHQDDARQVLDGRIVNQALAAGTERTLPTRRELGPPRQLRQQATLPPSSNYAPGVADRSAIEWTEASWNPATGCSKVSPGCAHCYAETFAERWRGMPFELRQIAGVRQDLDQRSLRRQGRLSRGFRVETRVDPLRLRTSLSFPLLRARFNPSCSTGGQPANRRASPSPHRPRGGRCGARDIERGGVR